MKNLTKKDIPLLVACVIIVVLVIVLVYQSRSGNNNNAMSNGPYEGQTGIGSPSAPTDFHGPTTPPPGAPTISQTPSSAPITFLNPSLNAVLIINSPTAIFWNHPAGISGQITLVDAKTQTFVGVVIPQLGPNQTSYSWNTRDLLLSRTSPAKKDVTPGTYMLKLSFDGNGVKSALSPAFTISK